MAWSLQRLKSTLAKPVVVRIETTWKSPCRMASPVPSPADVRKNASDHDRGHDDDADIRADLLVVEQCATVALHEAVLQCEVRAAGEHEDDHDPLDGRALVAGDR